MKLDKRADRTLHVYLILVVCAPNTPQKPYICGDKMGLMAQ